MASEPSFGQNRDLTTDDYEMTTKFTYTPKPVKFLNEPKPVKFLNEPLSMGLLNGMPTKYFGLRNLPRNENGIYSRSERKIIYEEVRKAVNAGVLIRPDRCELCSCEHDRLHGHHEDYGKPLEIKWFCPCCHVNLHAKEARHAT